MSTDPLAPIANKVKAILRMFSSKCEGDVLAAQRALMRLLTSNGCDIHVLADSIGIANGRRFSEADAAEIYRRGVEAGRREAELAQGAPAFHDVEDPSWHTIALECANHAERLRNDRERDFVHDMVCRTVHGGELSEKQANWLRSCYARVRR
jgi:hypothetical protein